MQFYLLKQALLLAIVQSQMLTFANSVIPIVHVHSQGVENGLRTDISGGIDRLSDNHAWDVQIIDTTFVSAKLPIFHESENSNDVFQKIMYLVRPENIGEVWIQGEKVHSHI
ncbi:hypothetical protein AC625_12035 [Peribacillus loiseleuriae]|uniref:Uncharacterized protein n=1 Tax=Peribacillus loiseleuriae TaxID=1679170 RepID=A0A0K9GU44_9BACI|nr:hypothetical protein AC625_12035 [Peribacillus loiseleuriae]